MYPEEVVKPMRQEAVAMGFQELRTAAEVNDALSKKSGTALVFVNSICGCAAGMARPGIGLALKKAEAKPDNLYTVFAGNDAEATKTARGYFHGYPPSSPSMALLKDGKIQTMIQRLDIEGHSADQVADQLLDAFMTYCGDTSA